MVRKSTRPKYTPDPPPANATPEQLVEWAHRQYNRIEDLWPKNLEERVKALEEGSPYTAGTWPIVDYSYVSFPGQSVNSVPSICDYSQDSAYTLISTTDSPQDFYDGAVKVTRDGLGMVWAGGQSSLITVWRKESGIDGPWTLKQSIPRPSPSREATEGWGFSVAYNEDAGLLISGNPECDSCQSGAGISCGAFSLLSGDTENGFVDLGASFDELGNKPRTNFGSGLDLSGDGNILAASGSGSDSQNVPSQLRVYEFNGSTYTLRQEITLPLNQIGTRDQGLYSCALNQDGSILIVGQSQAGFAGTGEVYVYDWSGSAYVLRQTILFVDSSQFPGVYCDGNSRNWGRKVALSSDEQSLMIEANYCNDSRTATYPNMFGYSLNPNTNLYEFCKLVYTADSFADVPLFGGGQVYITDQLQRMYLPARRSSYAGSEYRIHEYKLIQT